jgi:hypothetical protein
LEAEHQRRYAEAEAMAAAETVMAVMAGMTMTAATAIMAEIATAGTIEKAVAATLMMAVERTAMTAAAGMTEKAAAAMVITAVESLEHWRWKHQRSTEADRVLSELDGTCLGLLLLHVGPNGDGFGGQAFMEHYSRSPQVSVDQFPIGACTILHLSGKRLACCLCLSAGITEFRG